jgi:hypothetical protein
MPLLENKNHEVMDRTGRAFAHAGAVVLGALLMFLGVGMGVTLVMLPIGIGVGLLGLLSFLWGLFGYEK